MNCHPQRKASGNPRTAQVWEMAKGGRDDKGRERRQREGEIAKGGRDGKHWNLQTDKTRPMRPGQQDPILELAWKIFLTVDAC
jgi:hypothetical protein